MTQDAWHPLTPSSEVQAGGNIVAAFLQGTELAVWRSQQGDVQVWENRCPHRGVRLTLGQVLGDRLSCAYHGWQFAAGTAGCVGVPARPAAPLPGHVRVQAYPAAESSGMVWAALRPAEGAPSHDAVPPTFAFARSLAVRAPAGRVRRSLGSMGWNVVSGVWQCNLGGVEVRAFLLEAQRELVFLHFWAARVDDGLHGAIRNVRTQLQGV